MLDDIVNHGTTPYSNHTYTHIMVHKMNKSEALSTIRKYLAAKDRKNMTVFLVTHYDKQTLYQLCIDAKLVKASLTKMSSISMLALAVLLTDEMLTSYIRLSETLLDVGVVFAASAVVKSGESVILKGGLLYNLYHLCHKYTRHKRALSRLTRYSPGVPLKSKLTRRTSSASKKKKQKQKQ